LLSGHRGAGDEPQRPVPAPRCWWLGQLAAGGGGDTMQPGDARCRRLAAVLLRILRCKADRRTVRGRRLRRRLAAPGQSSTTCPTGFSGWPTSCTVAVTAIVAAGSLRHRRP
jgi:hypothetical protein